MEESPPPNPRCRLCLTAFDSDQSDNLLDIFGDQGAHLSHKIRYCTGVFISPEDDTPTVVCTNCAETVHFIDEFRNLCRRAEEQYESWAAGDGFDSTRWESYRHHVGELRRLLPTGEASPEDCFRPMVVVKQEDEDDGLQEQQEASVTFEWAEAEDMLEIKHEVDGDEGEDDVPRPKRAKVDEVNSTDDSSDERLKMARALYDHEVIWNKSHAGYDKPTKWNKIAAQLGMTVENLKDQWNHLRYVYHGRKRRLLKGVSGPVNPILQEPLYVLLEKMVGNRKKSKSKPSSTKEEVMLDRMELAQAVYEREIIWNRTHPQYNNLVCRESAIEELADELDISANSLKLQWKRLRDLYRLRCARVMEGKLDLDDALFKEPLHLLLEKMLRDNMDVGKRSTNVVNAGEETLEEAEKPCSAAIQNDKMALAQAFREREFIWNRNHPKNATKVTREAAWNEAAKELSMSVTDLKNQWRYMRDGYRVKWKRLQARPNDHAAIQATLNPLYQLMDKMLQEVPTPAAPPKPEQPKIKDKTSKPRRLRISLNVDNRVQIATAIQGHPILWNKEHPEYADFEKREPVWEQVAAQLSIPLGELKTQWKLLRDLYRGRVIRAASGKIPPNHPYLRQKLFLVLDEMLRDNMKCSKDRVLSRKKRPKKEKKDDDEGSGDGDGEGKETDEEFEDEDGEEAETQPERWGTPFDDKELRARLAEEIAKHEMLWNIDHADYSRGSLRGQVWTEIGNQLGQERPHAIWAWRRATIRHRRMIEQHGAVTPELLEQDPLHRMLHEVVYKAGEAGDAAAATAGDKPKKLWPPKRRYTGKKAYSDEGCFKVVQNGVTHYLRVCELCGKNVERSDFEYHMNRHNGLTPYACSYEGCDKAYGSKITRDRHEILVHTADAERFECDECGEKFKYRSKLEYHHAMNHKSLNHPCPVCGKDMKHKHALRNHMNLHKDNGFACPICGRVVQKKHTLDVHMRIHTNEKPYPCVLCGQSFRIKVLLKTHLAKVHNVAIEELEGPGPSGSGGK